MGGWREGEISLLAEAPLAWVCPNVIPAVQLSMSDNRGFRFTSREFRREASVQVLQGEVRLGEYPIGQVVVSDMMLLDGSWQSRVDPQGPAVKLRLVNN